MSRSLLNLYLQKAAEGDPEYTERLCKRLADRLVHIPTVEPVKKTPRAAKANVLKYSEEHRAVVPLFTSERQFQIWCSEHHHLGESISLLGADFCQALGQQTWIVVDPNSDHQVELPPHLVVRISESGFFEEEPVTASESEQETVHAAVEEVVPGIQEHAPVQREVAPVAEPVQELAQPVHHGKSIEEYLAEHSAPEQTDAKVHSGAILRVPGIGSENQGHSASSVSPAAVEEPVFSQHEHRIVHEEAHPEQVSHVAEQPIPETVRVQGETPERPVRKRKSTAEFRSFYSAATSTDKNSEGNPILQSWDEDPASNLKDWDDDSKTSSSGSPWDTLKESPPIDGSLDLTAKLHSHELGGVDHNSGNSSLSGGALFGDSGESAEETDTQTRKKSLFGFLKK